MYKIVQQSYNYLYIIFSNYKYKGQHSFTGYVYYIYTSFRSALCRITQFLKQAYDAVTTIFPKCY